MSNNPLVSILIAAYNAERYIKETLDSGLAQSYSNIEIVVVDDGSTDKTAALVQSYSDSRIRYIYQKNKGIIGVRNRLLKEARGEYITYLDSDDIYLKDKVLEEVKFLEAHLEYMAVYCDLRYFFDGAPNKLYRHRYTFHSGDIFSELLKKQFITNTTLMLRRSVIDKIGFYSETIGTVEDWSYFIKMARVGFKFGFLDKDLVRFRLRWDNNTRFDNQPAIQESALKIFENLKDEMSEQEQKKYGIEDLLFQHRFKVGLAYLGVGKKQKASAMFRIKANTLREQSILYLFRGLTFIIPSIIWKKSIEKAWNRKKRKLFVLDGN
ncbi:glycosyltransferase [Candidatus Jorgensenbacteria bacterium]|nr:glycosyltransferase [Candidatus Jorgensenbacteria bacterium]